MAFEIKEMTVNSTDNIHTLVGKIYIPDGEIKGLFQIVHGMTEHIGRYDEFMSFLAENGYIAFGYDHLGHGKTAKDSSEFGFFAHNNGWKYLVNDVSKFADAVKTIYPSMPLTLMGHSMGSFIARLAAENSTETFNKLIICGSGYGNPLAYFGLGLTKLIGKIKGEKYVSELVYSLTFGSYNKRFEGDSGNRWLSSQKVSVNKYETDPYCSFKFTVSAMHDLIMLNKESNSKKWFKHIAKAMPILLISGTEDPVGDYGNGIKKILGKLKDENANVEMKLYEGCRHEILGDRLKDEVYDDILNFA